MNPETRKFSEEWVRDLQKRLLGWYSRSGRDFPWRDSSVPYRILLAEKLLQQTAARPVVIHAYERFLKEYPAVELLARAESHDIVELIRELGLPERAEQLVNAAKVIVDQYGGQVPDNLANLLALPGIGDYIARAILCFGYGQPVAVVDTNVARWIFRIFGITEPLPNNPARNKKLLAIAQTLLDEEHPQEYNWAILDLCALVCTLKNPKCHICPLNTLCTVGRQRMNMEPANET